MTQEETKLRLEAEKAVVEVEACLKERLLYLEEWKLSASERLERQAVALERTRSAVSSHTLFLSIYILFCFDFSVHSPDYVMY